MKLISGKPEMRGRRVCGVSRASWIILRDAADAAPQDEAG
jgi:hypothetical protein